MISDKSPTRRHLLVFVVGRFLRSVEKNKREWITSSWEFKTLRESDKTLIALPIKKLPGKLDELLHVLCCLRCVFLYNSGYTHNACFTREFVCIITLSLYLYTLHKIYLVTIY